LATSCETVGKKAFEQDRLEVCTCKIDGSSMPSRSGTYNDLNIASSLSHRLDRGGRTAGLTTFECIRLLLPFSPLGAMGGILEYLRFNDNLVRVSDGSAGRA
jgi:hypothetical protein